MGTDDIGDWCNMKTSKVYSLSNEDFCALINSKKTYSDVLRALGLGTRGGSSLTVLKKRMKECNCSTSHFTQTGGERVVLLRKSLEEILVKNSKYSNISYLKKRILQAGLLEYKCALCGNEGRWQGHELVLQLDHINGIHNDHRLCNLRFLCPNCHSQTNTYSGRNVKS